MSLETIARNLASKGRNGDTMLVHMSPGEVRGLQQLARLHGTSLTINPYTGMPEAFSLKSVFKSVGNAVKSVVKPIAKVLAPLAPILPFIPIPGIGPLSSLAVRSLLSGTLGGFAGGKGFDLKRALLSGGAAYGLGSLMQPTSAVSSSAAAPMSAADYGAAVDSIDTSLGALQPNPVAPVPSSYGAGFDVTAPASATASAPSVVGATGPSTTVSGVERIPTVDVTGGTEIIDGVAPVSTPQNVIPGAGANRPTLSTSQGLLDLTGSIGENVVGAVKNLSLKDVAQLGTLGFTGYGAITTKAELDRQKEEAERILANQAQETAERVAYAQGILRDYPLMYERLSAEDVRTRNLAGGGMTMYDDADQGEYAYGGLAALARGGMPPRYLRGGGDGMSDSIKANIDGKQEARLADGEFVIPADVVSHIGNGSSNAGAKKLYAMMDRVRTARTGKKRQAPAVKTERYMPA